MLPPFKYKKKNYVTYNNETGECCWFRNINVEQHLKPKQMSQIINNYRTNQLNNYNHLFCNKQFKPKLNLNNFIPEKIKSEKSMSTNDIKSSTTLSTKTDSTTENSSNNKMLLQNDKKMILQLSSSEVSVKNVQPKDNATKSSNNTEIDKNKKKKIDRLFKMAKIESRRSRSNSPVEQKEYIDSVTATVYNFQQEKHLKQTEKKQDFLPKTTKNKKRKSNITVDPSKNDDYHDDIDIHVVTSLNNLQPEQNSDKKKNKQDCPSIKSKNNTVKQTKPTNSTFADPSSGDSEDDADDALLDFDLNVKNSKHKKVSFSYFKDNKSDNPEDLKENNIESATSAVDNLLQKEKQNEEKKNPNSTSEKTKKKKPRISIPVEEIQNVKTVTLDVNDVQQRQNPYEEENNLPEKTTKKKKKPRSSIPVDEYKNVDTDVDNLQEKNLHEKKIKPSEPIESKMAKPRSSIPVDEYKNVDTDVDNLQEKNSHEKEIKPSEPIESNMAKPRSSIPVDEYKNVETDVDNLHIQEKNLHEIENKLNEPIQSKIAKPRSSIPVEKDKNVESVTSGVDNYLQPDHNLYEEANKSDGSSIKTKNENLDGFSEELKRRNAKIVESNIIVKEYNNVDPDTYYVDNNLQEQETYEKEDNLNGYSEPPKRRNADILGSKILPIIKEYNNVEPITSDVNNLQEQETYEKEKNLNEYSEPPKRRNADILGSNILPIISEWNNVEPVTTDVDNLQNEQNIYEQENKPDCLETEITKNESIKLAKPRKNSIKIDTCSNIESINPDVNNDKEEKTDRPSKKAKNKNKKRLCNNPWEQNINSESNTICVNHLEEQKLEHEEQKIKEDSLDNVSNPERIISSRFQISQKLKSKKLKKKKSANVESVPSNVDNNLQQEQNDEKTSKPNSPTILAKNEIVKFAKVRDSIQVYQHKNVEPVDKNGVDNNLKQVHNPCEKENLDLESKVPKARVRIKRKRSISPIKSTYKSPNRSSFIKLSSSSISCKIASCQSLSNIQHCCTYGCITESTKSEFSESSHLCQQVTFKNGKHKKKFKSRYPLEHYDKELQSSTSSLHSTSNIDLSHVTPKTKHQVKFNLNQSEDDTNLSQSHNNNLKKATISSIKQVESDMITYNARKKLKNLKPVSTYTIKYLITGTDSCETVAINNYCNYNFSKELTVNNVTNNNETVTNNICTNIVQEALENVLEPIIELSATEESSININNIKQKHVNYKATYAIKNLLTCFSESVILVPLVYYEIEPVKQKQKCSKAAINLNNIFVNTLPVQVKNTSNSSLNNEDNNKEKVVNLLISAVDILTQKSKCKTEDYKNYMSLKNNISNASSEKSLTTDSKNGSCNSILDCTCTCISNEKCDNELPVMINFQTEPKDIFKDNLIQQCCHNNTLDNKGNDKQISSNNGSQTNKEVQMYFRSANHPDATMSNIEVLYPQISTAKCIEFIDLHDLALNLINQQIKMNVCLRQHFPDIDTIIKSVQTRITPIFVNAQSVLLDETLTSQTVVCYLPKNVNAQVSETDFLHSLLSELEKTQLNKSNLLIGYEAIKPC